MLVFFFQNLITSVRFSLHKHLMGSSYCVRNKLFRIFLNKSPGRFQRRYYLWIIYQMEMFKELEDGKIKMGALLCEAKSIVGNTMFSIRIVDILRIVWSYFNKNHCAVKQLLLISVFLQYAHSDTLFLSDALPTHSLPRDAECVPFATDNCNSWA